jgi:hypothetical protein
MPSILLGTLVSQGWLELFSIRFVMFDEAELAFDSSDRMCGDLLKTTR